MVKIHHGPSPTPLIHVFGPPIISAVPNRGPFEHFGGGGAGAGAGFGEHEAFQAAADVDPASAMREGLPEEVVQQSRSVHSRSFVLIGYFLPVFCF